MLHELPSLDVPIHRLHSARFDPLLLRVPLLFSLLSVVGGEVLFVAGDWHGEMRRFWVRVVQLSVINVLVETSDIFPRLSTLKVHLGVVDRSHFGRHLQALLPSTWLHIRCEF